MSKDLLSGFKSGLGFMAAVILVIGILFSVYAFVEPAQAPSAGSYYIDDNSQLIAKLNAINNSITNLSRKGTFAGYTSTAVNGSLGGLKGANNMCDGNYSGSHWASYEEIVSLGSNYPWTYQIWIRGVNLYVEYSVGGFYTTMFGSDSTNSAIVGTNYQYYYCQAWTTGIYNTGLYYYTGTSLDTSGAVIGNSQCSNTYRLGCVYN